MFLVLTILFFTSSPMQICLRSAEPTGSRATLELARLSKTLRAYLQDDTRVSLDTATTADGARRIDERLQPLHKALFLESNPIPAKWAVSQLGLMSPGIRLPLTLLSDKFHDQVRLAMQTASEALAA